MAKTGQRIFALTAATVFLVSSLAFSGLVIWQMTQPPKDESTAQDIQKLQEEQKQQASQNSSKGKPMENFTPIASVPDLQKIDLTVGTGAEVKEGDTVTVHYTGGLAKDGTIFESSKDGGKPVTFGLSQVIPGWTQGLPGMKVGGKRRLVIPSKLAYGEQGAPQGGIAPNSDLVFDIELIDIPPAQAQPQQ